MVYFDKELQTKIRSEFYHLDSDPIYGKRLFFDNAGGALRLKKCVEAKSFLEEYPDCPERIHNRARELKHIVEDGTKDILETIFGAKSGALITELTASQTMFHIVEMILENTKGTNAVVSSLEHPSAFDAVKYYCEKEGKELRVVAPNARTGFIEADDVATLVDKNTALVSVMSASNLTGAVMDIEAIVKKVRALNPDVYVISDAVQHAPHGLIDVEKTGLDGVNFAPYKFFGVRGCGFAYVSERVARLPHRKLIEKPKSVFELGTSAPGNFLATKELINYVVSLGAEFREGDNRRALFAEGISKINSYEKMLLERLVTGLEAIKGVKVMFDTSNLKNRDLIIPMTFDNTSCEEAVKKYEDLGVIVCDRLNTSMYAKRILDSLGISSCIRVSPLHCHSAADIDEFLDITERISI